jgi:hypothetical protein
MDSNGVEIFEDDLCFFWSDDVNKRRILKFDSIYQRNCSEKFIAKTPPDSDELNGGFAWFKHCEKLTEEEIAKYVR